MNHILPLLLKNFKVDTIIYLLISLFDIVLKLSAVVLFIPLLEYMQSNGDIDISLWYWKIITASFNLVGVSMSFITLSGFVILIVLFNEGIICLKLIYQESFPVKIQNFLRKLITQSILTKKYSFLVNWSSSLLVTYVTEHVTKLSNAMLNILILIGNFIQIIGLVSVLFLISFKLTVFVIVSLILCSIISIKGLKIMKEYSFKQNSIVKMISKFISEQITHIKYTNVSKIQGMASKKLMNALNDALKVRSTIIRITCFVGAFINSIYYFIAIVIVILAYEILKLPVNQVIVYLFIIASRLKPLISDFPKKYSMIKQNIPLFNDISTFIEDIQPIKNLKLNLNKISGIEIRNLNFSFSEKPMIKNLSIKMEENKIYTVIGPSGMGKTTFVDLILGLLEQSSGSVNFYVNGKCSDKHNHNIFYMTQAPALISGSVKENLCYINQTRVVSDNELWLALEKVHLKSTFLDRDGLETSISENAINLSMGQKQRLALARIFLSDYQLIVLDEFSNGIDHESKALIIKAIKEEVKNKICISISHDKDVIEMADEIIDFSEKSTSKILT